MIEVTSGRALVSGPMTIPTAAVLLVEGEAAIAADADIFDLAGVNEADSSALAVVFGWMRTARAGGKNLRLDNPPANLLSLAAVYGVSDLLPAH